MYYIFSRASGVALWCLLIFGSLCSCKKDEQQPASTKELLAAGKWLPVLLTAESTPVGGGTTTVMNVDFCAEEYIKLDYPDTFSALDGCLDNGEPPRTLTGTWSLSADEKKLTFTQTGSPPADFRVDGLTKEQLKISFEQRSGNIMRRYFYTYKH
ncbi:hypothetical protein [Hymenobacter koreensis]|uniref:Lipocalin-like domain-containing protein n=1 Tax=Hymenobacter koreensis TaxID=1084523 RepID=A0ABP8IY85_9BACT